MKQLVGVLLLVTVGCGAGEQSETPVAVIADGAKSNGMVEAAPTGAVVGSGNQRRCVGQPGDTAIGGANGLADRWRRGRRGGFFGPPV